jgi:hypothetical protein
VGVAPLRPEPRARLSPKGIAQVQEASGDPRYRGRVAPLLYFAAVPLTKPTRAQQSVFTHDDGGWKRLIKAQLGPPLPRT